MQEASYIPVWARVENEMPSTSVKTDTCPLVPQQTPLIELALETEITEFNSQISFLFRNLYLSYSQ